MSELKSPLWEEIIRHVPIDPFTPVGKKGEFCNLCKRLVTDTNFHGTPLHDSTAWNAELELFFHADLTLQTKQVQLARIGRQVNPESIRAQRHQMIFEVVLQQLFTPERRLAMETDIDNKMSDEMEKMWFSFKQQDAAAQLQVPAMARGGGGLIIPGRP